MVKYLNEINLPEVYDTKVFIETAKKIIAFQRRVSAESALQVGKILIEIKAHEGHGNWLSALDEIEIKRSTAEHLMKLAEIFGDDPEKIEGMGKSKAILISYLPEENLIHLKVDDVLYDQDGKAYTWEQVREMTTRDLVRKFNREKRELKDKADNVITENIRMEKENKRQTDLNEQLMKDANEFMADLIKKKDQLLKEKDEKYNTLRELTMEQQEEKKTGEEAISAIIQFRGAMMMAMGQMNKIKLILDPELRAHYYGAITFARQILKVIEERAGAYFGPMMEIHEEDIPKEGEEKKWMGPYKCNPERIDITELK
jgi:hypothetical protein